MTTMHGGLKGPDNMHVPYAWEFATQAARETGVGVDASGIGKLARQLDDNSLWMLVGTDPVTWKAAGGGGGFEPGTRMLFQQTTAPTGWTKDASHNDKALRVVSGAVGSGGSVGFSALFGRTATGEFTLATAQMPSHAHSIRTGTNTGSGGVKVKTDSQNGEPIYSPLVTGSSTTSIAAITNTGSGSAHSHSMDMRVQYVDVIIATKD